MPRKKLLGKSSYTFIFNGTLRPIRISFSSYRTFFLYALSCPPCNRGFLGLLFGLNVSAEQKMPQNPMLLKEPIFSQQQRIPVCVLRFGLNQLTANYYPVSNYRHFCRVTTLKNQAKVTVEIPSTKYEKHSTV